MKQLIREWPLNARAGRGTSYGPTYFILDHEDHGVTGRFSQRTKEERISWAGPSNGCDLGVDNPERRKNERKEETRAKRKGIQYGPALPV